jgi:hypothetical protein
MKPCPSRAQLEAAALAEVHENRILDMEQHAEGCPRCRHELHWLRTEVALFAQRAAREEVSRLWEGVEARRDSKRLFVRARAVLALAASALLVLGIASGVSRGTHSARHEGSEPLMSLETMSVDWQGGERASMPCYTPGFGIACGEVEYASR